MYGFCNTEISTKVIIDTYNKMSFIPLYRFLILKGVFLRSPILHTIATNAVAPHLSVTQAIYFAVSRIHGCQIN